MRRLRHCPSPALVIACVSLAVALGGTGYAAIVLPAGSVGTKQLRAGAVVGAKVKAHSLLASNFKAGQLPAGEDGLMGLPGPAGPAATKLFATVVPVAAGGPALGPASGLAANGLFVDPAAVGVYQLSFGQDVSTCAVVASPGGKITAGVDVSDGEASASTIGGGIVRVQTFSGGSPAVLDAFTIAVLCP